MPGSAAQRDTIFALSSGQGRAGVAVVRVTGPRAIRALGALIGAAPPVPRRARLAEITDPQTKTVIDKGLVVCFSAPASATGEDVAEFHVHGGRAVIAALIDTLAAQPGLRPAEAGEFTRRAFDNGKLDLTEVEGLADLINAETEAQRRQALRQYDGALARLYDGWRIRVTEALAHVEAAIDFPDEDLPANALDRALADIPALVDDIGRHLDDRRRGERLRQGLTVAIVGAPNVGKSSLLNRIAQRDAAIVAETAGTTRDVIEVHLDLAGYPVTLADTAGLRAAGDMIEEEGVRRARARAETADIRLVVVDAAAWPAVDPEVAETARGEHVIVVANKIDLTPLEAGIALHGKAVLGVSALTGEGVPALLECLAKSADVAFGAGGEAPSITRARHRSALQDCRQALKRAVTAAAAELAAEDLRLAAREFGRITGRVDVEDVLDIIFRDFCIGK